MSIADKFERAYYDAVYRVSKAAFKPVAAAFRDVLKETFEPVSPTDLVGSFFSWMKKY